MRTPTSSATASGADTDCSRSTARSTVVALLVTAGVAVVPAAVTFLLVHLWLDAGLRDFVPSFWNDQVGYWHRVGSFAEVALGTGYYSPDEVEMPLERVRYGVNGPWFPALYGGVAAVVGWGSATSIFVNMAVLGLGLTAFLSLTRLDIRGSLLTGIAVATIWPVLLYVPTASQESLHQALAMVIAGVFVRAIQRGPELSTNEKIAGVSLIVAASVFRYSWAILLPVLVVLFARQVALRRLVAALGVGVILLVLAISLTSALQPPGHNASVDALNEVMSDPLSGIPAVAEATRENLDRFLFPGWLDPTTPYDLHGSPLNAIGVQSWEIVGLFVLALLAATASLARRLPLPEALRVVPTRESMFHVVNIGATTGAALVLYIPNGYYRVLGAHLLLSVFVLVACRRFALVAVIVVLNLAMLSSFLDSYERWKPNFEIDRTVVARERAAFSRLIAYDSGARNPWCNTLLLPIELYDWRVTLVPPGIGVAYALSADLRQPPKSRYVLLTDDALALNVVVDRSRLKALGSFEAGTLYENPSSLCFGAAA